MFGASPDTEGEKINIAQVLYLSILGSLANVCYGVYETRHYTCRAISWYMVNPSNNCLTVVKWIFGYLRGTFNYLLYYGLMDLECVGFINANFAGDRDRRHSAT